MPVSVCNGPITICINAGNNFELGRALACINHEKFLIGVKKCPAIKKNGN